MKSPLFHCQGVQQRVHQANWTDDQCYVYEQYKWSSQSNINQGVQRRATSTSSKWDRVDSEKRATSRQGRIRMSGYKSD